MARGCRVLMSEGSSLSARESLTGLGAAGCRVDVVDANPLCLARFSKWCARLHRAPRFGDDPRGYLARVAELLQAGSYDVLYPAREQAYLFARHLGPLSHLAGLALPTFATFERLQSKVSFIEVLEELGLPHPRTTVLRTAGAPRDGARCFPLYVKTALGTATQGTFRVRSERELSRLLEGLDLDEGVLLQDVVEGRLGRAQSVFARGRLVGFHACVQVAEGVGGGDLVKESVSLPAVREHVERLGGALGWHGGLSLDFIADHDGRPWYIDANPRLAETGNALAAGVNLPKLLVEVSLGATPAGCEEGRPGVRTFMGLQALLSAAAARGSRRAVLGAVADLVRRRGVLAGASEELTPPADKASLVPLALVGATVLVLPRSWRSLAQRSVKAYAATPRVVDLVRETSDPSDTEPR